MVPDIVDDIAIVDRHQRDDLGDIERRAATEPDHRVGSVLAKRRSAGHHLGAGRVAGDAVEDRGDEIRQAVAELGEHRQPGQRRVGHDQRPRQTPVAQMRRH